MSAQMVTSTAMCQCTMGKAPAILSGSTAPGVMVENKPATTIMDFAPGPAPAESLIRCPVVASYWINLPPR